MSDPTSAAWWALYRAVQQGEHDLSHAQQAVIMAIVSRLDVSDPSRGAWPSIATIAHDSRLSRSTVTAALRAPKVREWVSAEHRTRDDGAHLSTCFRVAIPATMLRGEAPSAGDAGPVGPSGVCTPLCRQSDPTVRQSQGEGPTVGRGGSDSRTPLCRQSDPTVRQSQGEGPTVGRGGSDSRTPLCRQSDGEGPTVGPNLSQEINLIDQAHGSNRDGDARTAPPSVPFKLELSEPAPIPEAKSEKSAKAPKAPKSPTLAAWGEGIQRVTKSPWALSGPSVTGALGTIVSTYAPKGITGEALTAWLADAAERFARGADDFQTKRGFDPCDAKRWFSAGSPTTATTPKPSGYPVRVNASQPADPTDPTASHVVYEPLDNAAE